MATPFSANTTTTARPLAEEELTSQHRELILMIIIHEVSHKYLEKLIVITKTCIYSMILIIKVFLLFPSSIEQKVQSKSSTVPFEEVIAVDL